MSARPFDASAADEHELQIEKSVRPSLDDWIGQPEVLRQLRMFMQAAKERGEPLGHVLCHGPAGTGKTSLARAIADDMGTKCYVTSGPMLKRPGDIMGVLTQLATGDVLFVDECHATSTTCMELLYPVMQELCADFQVEMASGASMPVRIKVKPFTLIGATTMAGRLTQPFYDRFEHVWRLNLYSDFELSQIIEQTSKKMRLKLGAGSALLLASRGRGTPRIALRLMRRARDLAQVHRRPIDQAAVQETLDMLGIDELGLDELDRRYLRVLAGPHRGGPAGVEAMAATMGDSAQTLVDVVEPWLLHKELIVRTRLGRQLTDAGKSA